MKNSIKRAQSQARLSFAERENFRPKVKQLKKTLLTLVALLAVTTGAWATDDTYTVKFEANGKSKTIENVTLEKTWACNYNSENGELDQIIKELYELEMGYSSNTNPNTSVTGGNGKVTVVSSSDQSITITEPFEGTATVTGQYVNYENYNYHTFTYSLTISIPGYTASSSSGPEVAWNKAEKTGTFTMPGGNVTLEPEYYPQAALTAAPTAINDVPATTDGAIVNAGTVANIGETTNAQGTVMYYVSPTALDDDALLALAADQWTADVPTAAHLAQGQAYVYYYVRGNDSDNDEENFSDGDILAANALTVTIAAEPTYAVTFAEGTEESDKWTASPAADVKKGQTVTVTYTGTKKVIGVKAEKKTKPAGPVTVTWNSPSFSSNSNPYTQDGVTLTTTNNAAMSNSFYDRGDKTFTTMLGKFTKIEIVCGFTNLDGWAKEKIGEIQDPDDPDSSEDINKLTWTGNAESVTIPGNYVYTIRSITFYIQ